MTIVKFWTVTLSQSCLVIRLPRMDTNYLTLPTKLSLYRDVVFHDFVVPFKLVSDDVRLLFSSFRPT